MLDRNIVDGIENRIREVRDEGRDLTISEKDREYLFIALLEIINGSIFDLLAAPNMPPIEG